MLCHGVPTEFGPLDWKRTVTCHSSVQHPAVTDPDYCCQVIPLIVSQWVLGLVPHLPMLDHDPEGSALVRHLPKRSVNDQS